jgi:Tol biopolymer transport system component
MAADFSNQHIVKEMTTGKERVLLQASAKDEFCCYARWSPDGTKLALTCAPGFTGSRSVHTYLVDPESGRSQQLQVPADLVINSGPEWTPDGRALIFSALSGNVSALWRIPLEGNEGPRQLTRELTNDVNPSLSPDGRRVAFTRESTASTLLTLDVATGSMAELFKMSTRSDSMGLLSHHGGVVFSQTLGESSNIMWVPFSGGDPVAITQEENQSCDQPLSLDAETVAFVCTEVHEGARPAVEQPMRVWTADLQGGRRTKLLEIQALNLFLGAASSDGRLIAYTVIGDKGPSLHLFDRNLGKSRQLLSPSAPLADLTFTHDNRSLDLIPVRMAYDNAKKVPSLQRLSLADGKVSAGGAFPADLIEMAHFSRGGEFIAYTRRSTTDESRQQLWIWPTHGGQAPRLVIELPGDKKVSDHAVSDDGGTIVLLKRQDISDLYMMEGL